MSSTHSSKYFHNTRDRLIKKNTMKIYPSRGLNKLPKALSSFRGTNSCDSINLTDFLRYGVNCDYAIPLAKLWTKNQECCKTNFCTDSIQEDKLPSKCPICEGIFTDPIVSICKHYFCRKCVLKRYKKCARCMVCDARLMGIFNPADNLMASLKQETELETSSDSTHSWVSKTIFDFFSYENKHEGGMPLRTENQETYEAEICTDSSEDDELPSECPICQSVFANPIITKCEHYFCQKCVLKRYKKCATCMVCNARLGGIFNPATNLVARLKKGAEPSKANQKELRPRFFTQLLTWLIRLIK